MSRGELECIPHTVRPPENRSVGDITCGKIPACEAATGSLTSPCGRWQIHSSPLDEGDKRGVLPRRVTTTAGIGNDCYLTPARWHRRTILARRVGQGAESLLPSP